MARKRIPTGFNVELSRQAKSGVQGIRIYSIISTALSAILILLGFMDIATRGGFRYMESQQVFFTLVFLGLGIFGVVSWFRFLNAVDQTTDLVEISHRALERDLLQIKERLGQSAPPSSQGPHSPPPSPKDDPFKDDLDLI